MGVGRSRPFCLESESKLESVKFCRLQFRPGGAGYQPTADNDLGRTVMHRPDNIERQREEEKGSVDMRLKGHLVIGFRLVNGIGDNIWATAIVV